jgi:hypothetical protein
LLHELDVPGVTKAVDYYPAINMLYVEDLIVCDHGVTSDDIDSAFMNLVEDDGTIAMVLRSGNYYNAVGHTDSVYESTASSSPTLTPFRRTRRWRWTSTRTSASSR